jgi:AcrR family transcriptional regulator
MEPDAGAHFDSKEALQLAVVDAAAEILAFQIHALAQEANLRRELLDIDDAFEQGRQALADLIARTSAAALPFPRALMRSKESS